MLIALFVGLGVALAVVVAFAALVFGRRRWLKRQVGEFVGAIRVSSGEIDGLGSKWKRGSGRWVREVLVWSKAPFMFRNELVPVDRVRRASGARRRREAAGAKPVVIVFATDGAAIEVAAKAKHRALVLRPLVTPARATASHP